MTDLVIIGGGPAGLTAAIYAARAGAKVKVCEKNMYGGQTSIIDSIENYPGFKKINGFELANSMHEQAETLGVEFIFGEVVKADLKDPENRKLTLENGEELKCNSVIIANGLKRRLLGCEGEKEFAGKGVSYCATCDGAFFRSKDVIVVGGGNSALEDALYLSGICSSVTMVVRKGEFRGENLLAEEVKNKENIKVKFQTKLKKIQGDEFVTGAVLEGEDGKPTETKADAVFIAIGYEPDCKIYEGQVEMDESGYFVSDETCKTNLPGVFVAGDCRKKPLRQIVTATADGAVSGNKAAEYALKNRK